MLHQHRPECVHLFEDQGLKTVTEMLRKRRYKHHLGIGDFLSNLDILKDYCRQGDGNDWKRYLVCGVCWIDGLLAVNNRRFAKCAGCSKSTVNSLLAKLGLKTVALNKENRKLLIDMIPCLSTDCHELRQWTYRATRDQFLELQFKNSDGEPETSWNVDDELAQIFGD